MENNNLTYNEAKSLAATYQHLKGSKLFPDKDWRISSVAVAPANSLEKWLFAHIYMDTQDEEQALRFYKKEGYDVILISVYDPVAELVTFQTLDEYLMKNNREEFHYSYMALPASV